MKIHKSLARACGFELIPLDKLPTLESHIRSLFEQYNIDLVVDVGANTGQFAQMLRNRVGYEGEIHSFEPVPDVYQALEYTSRNDPLWHTHPIALGDTETYLDINVTESTDYSSFLKPNENSRRFRNSDTKIKQTVSVPVKRLDALLPVFLNQIAIDQKNIYLKLDTQGYDLNVMNGATRVLDNVRAIQTELSFIPIYADMPDYVKSMQYYRDIGFAPSGFHPISKDPESLRLIEADCILVRS